MGGGLQCSRGGNYPLPNFHTHSKNSFLKWDLEYGKRSKSNITKMSYASQVVANSMAHNTVPDEMESELLAHLDFICFLEMGKETRIIIMERKKRMSVRPMFDGAQQQKEKNSTGRPLHFFFVGFGLKRASRVCFIEIIRLRASI